MKNPCVEPMCRQSATSPNLTCPLHTLTRKQDLRYWIREDAAERLRETEAVPKPPEDDWRPGVFARARLPRPKSLLSESSSRTWRRTRPSEKTGTTRQEPVTRHEHDLWPVEFRLAHVELKQAVDAALKTIRPLYELTLRMRFGIPGTVKFSEMEVVEVDSQDEQSLNAIGELRGLSRERIRQVEKFALTTLAKRKHLLVPHLTRPPR